jgi:hypothetical protein
MRTLAGSYQDRICQSSLRLAAALGAIIVGISGATAARAGVTLVYSFEGGDPQGFSNNYSAGPENEVSVDTIGATEGAGSLKFALVQEEFFAGILTSFLPEAIGDPPGVDFVLFDLTIPEPFGDQQGFARTSVTIFGFHPELGGGLQAQFLDNEVSIGDLPAGTHEIRINLSSAVQFNGKSFNEIFGPIDDPTQVIPSGFQIYINKSVTAPFTVYFDNIRVGSVDADFNGDGNVNGLDLGQWTMDFGVNGDSDADGDGDSDGADFLIWQRELNTMGDGLAPAPEPATTALAGTALLALLGTARNLRRSG